ncbi:hypothetical protein BCR34DRAFT_10232 [Clohesyomyces aquaticus]|uniref:Uncharacterized protein n=1 Tax=Clohesyomyces aquaticus TaxID=1231657 RepID=A0A1Y2A5R4_9PLEO|nr:hypothetical protein BCR34DRAFT_10232 [Clohesyomyces aquaticus]
MNRFLHRKKDRALDDNVAAVKKTKKGKKGMPEPKLELDVAAALPTTDDFRTSLIMPSLSTRFSMLREQDDPSSKIGKASDDSVLIPKRQSRLHEFGFVPGGLSDIAEVSSINGSLNGSIRPPFANERQNSFDSQSPADDNGGSMMSRARPGEGNVLFGGRQKIYMISNTGSSKSLGRALYDDDVSQSTFQKLRAQEREKARLAMEGGEKADETPQATPASPTKDELSSPSVSDFNQRRETSSSTNSGTANTRASTAATSIASQGANAIAVSSSPALPSAAPATSPTTEANPLNRSTTKARRMYETGLDQHIYDQQSSALNRLNSIQRTRAPTGRSTPPLLYSQTRSATNLNDRFNRSASTRTASPTQMGSPLLSRQDTQSSSSSPVVSRPHSPPLSPLASDSDEAHALHSALQPNDRGKATAMGAFNKPKQAFSEQQYAERLKRMQQEREPVGPKLDKPPKPSLRERAALEQRKRAEAGVTERQRSNTADRTEAPSAFSVFQNATNQLKSPTKKTELPQKPEPSPQDNTPPDSQKGGTFFTSPHSSDDEEEPKKKIDIMRRLENIPAANRPAPPILDHPALRSRSSSRAPEAEHPALRSHSQSRAAPTQQHDPMPSPKGPSLPNSDSTAKAGNGPDVDSPTLGPENGGLGGLIRQHLRGISNVSSDYGDDNQIVQSPPLPMPIAPLSVRTQDFQRRQPNSESDTPAHSSYSHSNPWDLDDIENPYYGEGDSISSVSPVDAHKQKTGVTGNTQQTNAQARNRSASQDDGAPQWEKDIKKSTHQRDLSSATQEEHDAFQRELAQRRRAIEENLRTNSDENSRSVSPAPSAAAGGGGLKNALSMLRSKSSRESFALREDPREQERSNKAMRMLGIGTGSANASSTSLSRMNHNQDRWEQDEDRVGRIPTTRQKPIRVLEQSEQDARREFEQRLQRTATDESSRDTKSKGRSPPASSKSSTRARSSSELSSGRSRSRGGRYRDDLEQAMVEGMGSRSTVYPPNPPSAPSMPGYVANPTQPLTAERPSLDSQNSRMRSRSNSRATAAAGFLQPIQTGPGAMNGSSPRLSPAGNSPKPPFSPGLPVSPRPSPGAPSPNMNAFRPQASPVPAFAVNNTPPVSGTSTPVTPGFNSNGNPLGPVSKSTAMLRKKSIAKTDISEPIFVSATSVMDTVDLPAGASLKNGMDLVAPPVPPINPMRRRFGFGRTEPHHDPAIHTLSTPHAPFADPQRTNSSDALSSQATNPISEARQRLRKTSSEGHSLHGTAQSHAQLPASTGPSPAMPSTPRFGRTGSSPPRPINDRPMVQRPMDGSMF